MSIQIYQDENSVAAPFGRKTKREENKLAKHAAPKPNKRVALGNITNQVQGSRVQPSRAAKDKHKTIGIGKNQSQIKIHEDILPSKNSTISDTLATLKESPMVLSFTPCISDSFEEIDTDEILSEIKDIDKNTNAAVDLSEYAHDIHNYLRKAEVKYCPKMNYMRKQGDINISMRSILVDWLVEVSEEYKLTPQTLYLTVNFIDRFLSCMSVLRGKLQLVGTSCMLVASKFEEIYPPEVAEFVYITDDTYTAKQVLRMESVILKTLSFELSVPTCREFLNRYLLAAGASDESQLRYLSQFLSELTLIDYEVYLKYYPSTIAAASVLLANCTLKMEPWSTTLQYYSGYDIMDLKDCANDIRRLFICSPDIQQQSIQNKYKAPRFGCVSKLSPPEHRI